MNKFIPEETLLTFTRMSNQFYAIRNELVEKCLNPVMNQAVVNSDLETLINLQQFAYTTEAFLNTAKKCDEEIERIRERDQGISG
jgi:predicted nucleic-acid-binding protein